MARECRKYDAEEIEKVRKASWLCHLFQQYNLSVEEKKKILKDVTQEYKLKECLNGQSN